MSLLTFEKYLREQEDIHVVGLQGNSVRISVGGAGRGGVVWREYEDDAVFSITGKLVGDLRALYPEAAALTSSPLVQVARGIDVDGVLAGIDIPKLAQFLESAIDQQLIEPSDCDAIRDYHGALVEGQEPSPVMKYRVLDQVHKLAVRARSENMTVIVESDLPAAQPDEIMGLLCGLVRKSLHPPAGGALPAAIIAAYQEVYPECQQVGNGFVLRGEVVENLLSALGLSPSNIELGPKPELPPAGGAQAPPASGPSRENPPNNAGRANARAGGPCEGTEAGIEHVEQWCGVDPNALSPEEREIYLYGFAGAKKWVEKLSPGARRRIFKNIDVGPHECQFVIADLARNISRELGQTARKQLSPEQLAQMAGSRVLAQLGNWDISDSGTWTRRR